MQIVPVIDLKQGLVVRGVAGRRAEYQPIVSQLTSSACPGDVAKALFARFGVSVAYVADLDAIGGAEPDWRSYEKIAAAGLSLWIDAGVRTVESAQRIHQSPSVSAVIVGLETLPERSLLAAVIHSLGPDHVIFSLDLMNGQPRTPVAEWGETSALAIAAEFQQMSGKRLLLLDVADVGTNRGPSTLALTRELRGNFLHLELSTGGGVRNETDLAAMEDAGCDYALVATALHDGRLTAAELNRYLP
jgi:phosphoribosylformimino-5-aminoimidazole carboxamide ribotide isomerase